MENSDLGGLAQDLNEVHEEELTFEDEQLESNTAEDMKHIIEELGKFKELQEVHEEGLSFEDEPLILDTAEDVKDIIEALGKSKVVHYLKLGGNTLGVDAAASIAKGLEAHPEFRKALWYNMFWRRTEVETLESLKYLSKGLMTAEAHLTVLDLSNNKLGINGMTGLEDLLRSPVIYSLQELCLNNCGLGIDGGKMLSHAILDCYSGSVKAGTPLKLKVFVAGRNELRDEGAKAIAKIFSTLKTLEEVIMPTNSIFNNGIAALATGLKENRNLRILDLRNNAVGEKCAVALAEAFSQTLELQVIHLGDCLVNNNCAYHLAEALKEKHFQLEDVDLGFNDIEFDGALMLIMALKNKPNLKKLNLNGNQFGSDGCELIRKEMQCLANLEAFESLDDDQYICESYIRDHDEEHEADKDDDNYGSDGCKRITQEIHCFANLEAIERIDEDQSVYDDDNYGSDGCKLTTEVMQRFANLKVIDSLDEDKSIYERYAPDDDEEREANKDDDNNTTEEINEGEKQNI